MPAISHAEIWSRSWAIFPRANSSVSKYGSARSISDAVQITGVPKPSTGQATYSRPLSETMRRQVITAPSTSTRVG